MLEDSLTGEDRLVFDLAFQILAAGAMDVAQLVDEIRSGHPELAHLDGAEPEELIEDLIEILTTTDRFWVLDDEIIVRSDLLLDGVVLTHRLTADEVAEGAIEITADFAMIDFDFDYSEDVVIDGEVVEPKFDLSRGWRGWGLSGGLPDGLGVGDLIGLRRRGQELVIEHGAVLGDSPPAMNDTLLEIVADRIAAIGEGGVGLDATRIVMDALVGRPDLLATPTVPLTELLDAAGADRIGGYFGPNDVEWEPPGARLAQRMKEELFKRWRFDECCEEAFAVVNDTWTAHRREQNSDGAGSPPEHGPDEIRRALAHSSVSLAFFEFLEPIFYPDEMAAWLTPVVDSVRRDAAPAMYLLGRVLERGDQMVEAESWFQRATVADSEFVAPYESLGVLAFERGDFARAVSLLARRSSPGKTHPLVGMIEKIMPTVEGVGRNEPCPCGSGRKFKACHRGKPFDPDGTVTAAQLLINKAMVHVELRKPAVRDGLLWKLDEDAYERLQHDEFVVDIAVFETGVLAEYLASHVEVLPAAELEEGMLWLATPRRLFEIVGVEAGEWLELLDVTSGDTHHLIERSGSQGVEVGDYMLCRVALGHDGPAIIGMPVMVPLRSRESLLEVLDAGPEAGELVKWWSGVTAPPEIRNRSGHDLVFCDVVVDPGVDSTEAERALDGLFGADARSDPSVPSGDDGIAGSVDSDGSAAEADVAWHWEVEADDGSGEMLAAARVELVEGLLQAGTNSVERADELLADLGRLFPAMAVVSDERTPFDEMTPEDSEDNENASGMIDPATAPPEVQEAMREYMREFEENWLDVPLPALEGMTPRDAVADPTRRDDVERILSDFAPRDDEFGMDADRIRRLLGLAE